jgi:hypothetical protein
MRVCLGHSKSDRDSHLCLRRKAVSRNRLSALIVIDLDRDTPGNVAVIVACPALNPVIKPEVDTMATDSVSPE